jgi:hypothetical protein
MKERYICRLNETKTEKSEQMKRDHIEDYSRDSLEHEDKNMNITKSIISIER